MRLANETPTLHERGTEIVAISVDSPERNAAFARRWHLPFPIVSDPGGERWLQPLDRWNPGERGGIGQPGLILTASDGSVPYRFDSRDFADRPTDDDLLAAASKLGLTPIELPAWQPDVDSVEAPEAFRTDAFGAYFRGARSMALAFAMRAPDDPAKADASTALSMAQSFIEAWKERRAAARSGTTGGP